MSKAKELALIAIQNSKTFKSGDIVKCDGQFIGYPKGIYIIDCEGTLPNHWYLKPSDGRKNYTNGNGVPEKHLSKYSYEEAQKEFREKVHNLSKEYVKGVINRCEELAKLGYGSVAIKIDCTTDLFDTIESCRSGYSHDTVVNLLAEEGFSLEFIEDFYDAKSYILYWQVKPDFSRVDNSSTSDDEELIKQEQEWKRTKLPQAPYSERIGMVL